MVRVDNQQGGECALMANVGIDIAPRHQGGRFPPLSKAEPPRRLPWVGHGSGMGRTVAQVLTERQGGPISLHGSDEGRTRVIVWLEETRT